MTIETDKLVEQGNSLGKTRIGTLLLLHKLHPHIDLERMDRLIFSGEEDNDNE